MPDTPENKSAENTGQCRAPLVLLLGAGASAGAGLPTAVEMTEKVFQDLKSRPGSSSREVRALATVIGGLKYKASFDSSNPFDEIDIEQVAEALQMLSEPSRAGLAPFVAAWHPAVEFLDRVDPAELEFNDLNKAFKDALWDGRPETGVPYDFSSVSAEIQRLFVQLARQGGGAVFRSVLRAIVWDFVRLLWLRPEEQHRVSFLDPLAHILSEHKPLKIFTLNYDNTIELWASSRGIGLNRGFSRYYTEYLTFPDSCDVHLYKLHGSLDWFFIDHGPKKDSDIAYPWTTVGEHDPQQPRFDNAGPALVFGRRNKLSTIGPFFDLLREFSGVLNTTDHLVVVGYSFRDVHINDVIGRWLNTAKGNRITTFNGENASDGSLRANGFGQAIDFARVKFNALNADAALRQLPGLLE